MKNLVKKILIGLLALTLYCNIGWVVGSYYLELTSIKPSELSLFGKITAWGRGDFSLAQGDRPMNNRTSPEGSIFIFGALWPVGLAMVVAGWIVYGLYYACWFIFAGGAAKLLGLV